MSERFTIRQRLTRTVDYVAARRAGKRIDCSAFLMQIWASPIEQKPFRRRLGVIASRKVGPAVQRNRAKRIVRELFRRHQEALPENCDVVITTRSHFHQYSFQELQKRYLQACRKAPISARAEDQGTKNFCF